MLGLLCSIRMHCFYYFTAVTTHSCCYGCCCCCCGFTLKEILEHFNQQMSFQWENRRKLKEELVAVLCCGGSLCAWFGSTCPLRGKSLQSNTKLFRLITFILRLIISILIGVVSSRHEDPLNVLQV